MQDFLSRISHLSPKRLALLADELQRRVVMLEQEKRAPIAIIGIGCRFPGGADTPDRYWDLLRHGVDAISEVPASRWDIDAYYDPDPDAPGKMSTRFGGFLGDVDGFDPYFFGISPREAQRMDPQQRLLLEVAWEALEHAGVSADVLNEARAAVFVGMSAGDYFQVMRDVGLGAFDAYTASGTAHSIASGRLSYVLGARGPSVSIDTACSSSLVAIHQAVQSLRRGEAEIALAGGVNLILRPDITVALTKSHMMAPDGRCKAFDARADGFVRGEGCGMLVLKRLADAQAAGDNIIAVIRGSAANQDGRSNGLTAPNGPAQESVLRDALMDAQLPGRDVGVVEAHGTGTSLGDPIEVRALARVYGDERQRHRPLIVTSVKANIGHLEACAGVAGVIKMALCLERGLVPPQQHFVEPNPYIPWDELPVRVPTSLEPFPATETGTRIAGVSSFGFSGTNVHLLLEAAPERAIPDATIERPEHLVAISARTEKARSRLAAAYRAVLAEGRMSLADLAHTTNVGRASLPQRMTVRARTTDEAVAALDAILQGGGSPAVHTGAASARAPQIGFLFTGQGAQYPGMARTFYETQPAFRAALSECADILASVLPQPLTTLLFPDDGAPSRLDDTVITQPVLFAIEYSMAAMWQSWGVKPMVVMGHSVGEFVAACVAGILTLPDALRLVAERGRLMGALPRDGAMVAVMADESRVMQLIAAHQADVAVAAVNGPESVVVSGRASAIDSIVANATAQGISATRLQVSHAFHSPLMEPMIGAFRQVAESVTYHPPGIDVISNVTGARLERREISAEYWCRHVRAPVQFARGVQAMAALGCTAFIEVGPHPTLLSLARQSLSDDGRLWLPTVRRSGGDWAQVLGSLATLYVNGAQIDWGGFDSGYARRRQVLPRYPFQRDRYWVDDAVPRTAGTPLEERLHPLVEREVLQAASASRVFETQLSTERFEYLVDHRIFGRLLLPSPVLMEMAGAVGRHVLGEDGVAIRSLSVRGPIVVDGTMVTSQLVVDDAVDGVRPFRVATLEGQRWSTVATGSIERLSPEQPAAADLGELQQSNPTPIDVEGYYSWLAALDLEFGPRFRGIAAISQGHGSALARVVQPNGILSRGYTMHPAVLDSCFHAIGAALRTQGAPIERPYLLSHVERIAVYRALPASFWVHVSLEADAARGPHGDMVRSTMTLLQDDGRVLARFEGVQLNRAQQHPSLTSTSSAASLPAAVQDMLHEISWIEGPPAGYPVPTPSTLAAAVMPKIDGIAAANGLSEYARFARALDALCSTFILDALGKLGAGWQAGTRFETAALQERLQVLPRHARLLARMLDILAEDGYLERDGSGWVVARMPDVLDPESERTALALAYPAGDAALALTSRCARELAPVLRGQSDPLQLLFPGGSLTEMERLYQTSPPARSYNELLAESLKPVRDAWPGDRPLRILEVGAGTGSTSAYVLPMLAGTPIEYTFTDVSTLFLNRAREKFAEVPGMHYAALDIGSDPVAQGFVPGHYDVVIGANVVHATADLKQTMTFVRTLLAPGGLVVLLEGTSPQRFGDLTVGLLEGWWAFSDTDRRQYALMPRDAWTSLFLEAGFASSTTIVEADAGPVLEEQAIFVAQAPVVPLEREPRRWVVVPDSTGVAKELVARLEHAGDIIVTDGAVTAGPVAGVLYLRALDVRLDEHTAAETLWQEQEALLTDALRTVQTLAASTSPAPLWFVTRGAQAVGSGDGANPAQAVVWGLSHVVAIEHPELSCRRVDLDPQRPVTDSLDLLVQELHVRSAEDQVALRGPRRLLRRLTSYVPTPAPTVQIHADKTYLIVGGLRGLGLRIADWIADRGARSIALLGRQAPGASAEAAISRLRERGVNVVALRGDVSVEADVCRVLATVRESMAPLAGIIHSAGTLDDGVIAAQTWARFRRVMAAKVLGSWHLHRLAGPLDFLVLFSSGASVAGSAGQANHAAANAFEDALAWYRQSLGLPTVSINWGPWAEIGAAAERQVTGGSFLRQIPPDDGLLALEAAMRQAEDGHSFARAQVAVLAADWSQITAGTNALLQAPLFRRLAVGAARAATSGSRHSVPRSAQRSLRERLQVTAANRRRAALLDEVRQLTVRVLGVAQPGALDVNEPLRQLGLDSLMAVELRNLLGKTVGRTLPATITFDHPTVNALVTYLSTEVFAEEFAVRLTPRGKEEASVVPPEAGRLPDLEGMTDDELALRLAHRLDRLNTLNTDD
jgi:acyl transferase domain-containing protein/SAM-dependent methyltransferase/acyl carrier protein